MGWNLCVFGKMKGLSRDHMAFQLHYAHCFCVSLRQIKSNATRLHNIPSYFDMNAYDIFWDQRVLTEMLHKMRYQHHMLWVCGTQIC